MVFLLAGYSGTKGTELARGTMDNSAAKTVIDNEQQSQPGGGPIGREICKEVTFPTSYLGRNYLTPLWELELED